MLGALLVAIVQLFHSSEHIKIEDRRVKIYDFEAKAYKGITFSELQVPSSLPRKRAKAAQQEEIDEMTDHTDKTLEVFASEEGKLSKQNLNPAGALAGVP